MSACSRSRRRCSAVWTASRARSSARSCSLWCNRSRLFSSAPNQPFRCRMRSRWSCSCCGRKDCSVSGCSPVSRRFRAMVQVGLLLSDVPSTVPPAQQFKDIVRVAQTAERNGFTYIAIGQHFLYGDLRWLQPVPLLARLAGEVGPQVRLVTQIMVAPLYHPLLLAADIATLDIVTQRRLIFGAGLGYRAEEFDYFGVPYRERAARMDEALVLLNKLWTNDEVTFDGRFWKLEGVRPHIQPVQSPHPPIWIGAHSLAGAKRAGKFGDAYATPPETRPHEIAERFEAVREGFSARGKAFGPQPLRRNV